LTTGGFTLIENLITLAIMSFVMLALVGLLGAVIAANATNKKHVVAVALAEGKIAEVRRKGYDSTLTVNPTVVSEPYNSAVNTPMNPYPNFRRDTSTQLDTPMAGMQTVTVTVYWDQDRHWVVKTTILGQ
jgi:prepilin-type N-terminal cleavage/methylation domain-containing protein